MTSSCPGSGRSLRRQKRAERLKVKYAAHRAERARRKELVKVGSLLLLLNAIWESMLVSGFPRCKSVVYSVTHTMGMAHKTISKAWAGPLRNTFLGFLGLGAHPP